jgi:hypothetical protein
VLKNGKKKKTRTSVRRTHRGALYILQSSFIICSIYTLMFILKISSMGHYLLACPTALNFRVGPT